MLSRVDRLVQVQTRKVVAIQNQTQKCSKIKSLVFTSVSLKQCMLCYISFLSSLRHINLGVYIQNLLYTAKLQTLQNKAIRLIEGLNWNARVENVYNKHQIFTISKMYKYDVGKMMYLCNVNRLPESYFDYYSYISFSSADNTRGASARVIHLPQFSSNKLQHFFKFQNAKIWNAIPIKKKDLFKI